MARSAKTNTTPRSAMNKRLPAAAGAALMLALSGCSIPNVVEQFNAPVLEMQQATVSNRELQLREKLGQRVSLGPVSFWYTMDEGGWGVPYYYSGSNHVGINATVDGKYVAEVDLKVDMDRDKWEREMVPYVPEGSPDSAYIEAADSFVKALLEVRTYELELDDWEIKHCDGGVIATSFYTITYAQPSEYTTANGYFGLVFTEDENYICQAHVKKPINNEPYLADMSGFISTLTIE